MSTIAKFAAAVETAANHFDGWDWTMTRQGEDGEVYEMSCLSDTDGMPDDVVAWAQEYDAKVEGAVTEAADAANDALISIEAGDLDEARDYVESAMNAERQFGDCPAYRVLSTILDEIEEEIDSVADCLTAVDGYDDVGFGHGNAVMGIDLFGSSADPRIDCNIYTYDMAIQHCIAGTERGIALAAARKSGVKIDDYL